MRTNLVDDCELKASSKKEIGKLYKELSNLPPEIIFDSPGEKFYGERLCEMIRRLIIVEAEVVIRDRWEDPTMRNIASAIPEVLKKYGLTEEDWNAAGRRNYSAKKKN